MKRSRLKRILSLCPTLKPSPRGHLSEPLEVRTLLSAAAFKWVLNDSAAIPSIRLSAGDSHTLAEATKATILNLTGADVSSPFGSPTSDTGGTARFRTGGAMPADGNYELRLPTDGTSPALTSELLQSDFFLNADFNRDRVVDFTDLLHFLDETAVDGNKYWYRIRPYYSTVDEDCNTTITQHLPTTNEAWRVAALKPPSNVQASGDSAHTMTVTWDDDSSGETGYRIEVRAWTPDGSGTWTTAGMTDANETAFGVDASFLGASNSNAQYEARVTSFADGAGIESAPAESEATNVTPDYDHIDAGMLPPTLPGHIFGPKETYTITVGGQPHANHMITWTGGGAHSTIDQSSVRASGDGTATFTLTGTDSPGEDFWTVTDNDAPSTGGVADHAYYRVVTLANSVSVGGGVHLVEDDTQGQTFTVTRGNGSPTAVFDVHLSLDTSKPDAAGEDDVKLSTKTVHFGSNELSKSVTISVANNDEVAEGLESIYVNAKPDGGAPPSTQPTTTQPATTQAVSGVGTIDDDVFIKNIEFGLGSMTKSVQVSPDDKGVSVNGFFFTSHFKLTGKHLDKVRLNSRLTRRRSNRGPLVSPAQ